MEKKRVLFVDDELDMRLYLATVLRTAGYEASGARNAREALERARQAPPDLILMDVMMPVKDGLTATREIRRDPRWTKLPIITLTAKAMPDDQQKCIDAGANDYMSKPIDVDKLLSLVRVWMPR